MQKESLIEEFEEKSKVSVIDILKIMFNENKEHNFPIDIPSLQK